MVFTDFSYFSFLLVVEIEQADLFVALYLLAGIFSPFFLSSSACLLHLLCRGVILMSDGSMDVDGRSTWLPDWNAMIYCLP